MWHEVTTITPKEEDTVAPPIWRGCLEGRELGARGRERRDTVGAEETGGHLLKDLLLQGPACPSQQQSLSHLV